MRGSSGYVDNSMGFTLRQLRLSHYLGSMYSYSLIVVPHSMTLSYAGLRYHNPRNLSQVLLGTIEHSTSLKTLSRIFVVLSGRQDIVQIGSVVSRVGLKDNG